MAAEPTTTTTSLSKGVFGFSAKSGKGKKKKPSPVDYVESQCNFAESQTEHYKKIWSSLQQKAETVQNEVASNLFDGLVEYAKVSCSSNDEIPAAALVTGVNTPDHNILFEQVKSNLDSQVSPYVVLLRPKTSNNIKNIMNSIYTQLTQNCVAGAGATFSDLEKWYLQKSKGFCQESPRKSPSKKKKTSDTRKPIIIILEDFCGFPKSCMHDLIVSCRNHLQSMPCLLIFGVSLSLSSLRQTLTHEISSMLSIEAFQMTHSSVYLSVLIEKLLIECDLPFRLGGKPFQLLLDNFLCHDFSIQKFIHGLKFCLMEHCLGGQADVSSITSNSKGYVESRKPEEQIQLLEDDKCTIKTVKRFLFDLEVYHQGLSPLLKCLYVLSRDLPGAALGRQGREIYCATLSDNFPSRLSETFKLLGNLSRNDLTVKVQECLLILNQEDISSAEQLRVFIDRLHGIDTVIQQESEEVSASKSPKNLPKKMNLYDLRKTLQEQKPRHVALYESIRQEILEYLLDMFRTKIVSYKTLPLYELWYFENVRKLKAAVSAMPRAAVDTALNKPHVYLEEVKPTPSDQNISSHLPDTSIVFKLHSECGAMINIYDWMQAFISVHSSGNSKTSVADLSARFTHSAAELQYLGFIKSTKRKTDHVARLTWGSV